MTAHPNTTTDPVVEVLDDRVSAHPQGWQREVTYRLLAQPGVWRRVKATVYRDSYDFQSRLHVEVWSPAALEWHRVQSLSGLEHGGLPSSGMLRRGADPYATEKIRAATQPVLDDLIAYAVTVLS